MELRATFEPFVFALQDTICKALEQADGQEVFKEDSWERPGGGGGRSRVLERGKVFEKAGVNVSVVHGQLPDILKKDVPEDGVNFYACGISLVIHPLSPLVPTTHANYRYFGVFNAEGKIVDEWFGGGADLTPYYLDEEDALHFHQVLKNACDKTDIALYPKYKQWCDEYFYNTHRGEGRGIGGVFYDHLRPGTPYSAETLLQFAMNNGNAFIDAYLPIVEKQKNTPWTAQQKNWQEIRRGRYVEFNLIHDRGTLFGLKTGGRTESILMSLPPTVRWEYSHQPSEGSEEAALIAVLKEPKQWIANHATVSKS